MRFKFNSRKLKAPFHICNEDDGALCQIEKSAPQQFNYASEPPIERRICKLCNDLMARRGFSAEDVQKMRRRFDADLKAQEMVSRIDSLRTKKGGWSKNSLASLNVPWPPPKGWRKLLILETRRRHIEGGPQN